MAHMYLDAAYNIDWQSYDSYIVILLLVSHGKGKVDLHSINCY